VGRPSDAVVIFAASSGCRFDPKPLALDHRPTGGNDGVFLHAEHFREILIARIATASTTAFAGDDSNSYKPMGDAQGVILHHHPLPLEVVKVRHGRAAIVA
jgi:hypothetical protein